MGSEDGDREGASRFPPLLCLWPEKKPKQTRRESDARERESEIFDNPFSNVGVRE
jgi:hypothetical protein